MRTLYLDCFAGVSGDMFVGALLDCGLSLDVLKSELAKLGLNGYEISATRVDRSGISSTKFDVHVTDPGPIAREAPALPHSDDHHKHDHHHHGHAHGEHHDHEHGHSPELHHEHRSLSSIREMIANSGLGQSVRNRAIAIFERLGSAEAKVHNIPIDRVHFHEVGAVDSIVDIVGASIALEVMGIDRIRCSRLHVGSGTFNCAHGTYPVPGPATAELLVDIPFYSGEVNGELVTPTGAAIVSSLAESFGPIEGVLVEVTGYGAGTREYEGFPNVLRAFLGNELDDTPARIAVLETNLDDLNPQVFGYVLDLLLEAGALDVFYTPVQMKKNRPGTLLTVLARVEDRTKMTEILFRETTTLGVRHRLEERELLLRSYVTVSTEYGEIRIKVARDAHGKLVNYAPEFDDCLSAASTSRAALREVQLAATAAFLSQKPSLTS
jgi:pyridinium-3,5-bisthiocarboxylic acid mononucleotide nickel chelatase